MPKARSCDENLLDRELTGDAPQVFERSQHGMAGDVLLLGCSALIDQPHHPIADLWMVLEFLEQPDRRDTGAHDQRGDVMVAAPTHGLADAVEEDAARTLEHQAETGGSQNDRATDLDLLDEKADRGEHQQSEGHAAHQRLELVDQGPHARGAVDPEEPASRDPRHHHDGQHLDVGVEGIDRSAQYVVQAAPGPIGTEPCEHHQTAIHADVEAAQGDGVETRHRQDPSGKWGFIVNRLRSLSA